ncbi:MAG: hypothetical protein JXQ71_01120 [Verrucomicrobia bacterium]|nr:hypothetical protein [Verrucomicrobiota bacterium]
MTPVVERSTDLVVWETVATRIADQCVLQLTNPPSANTTEFCRAMRRD